jgi:hypothetical protein
MRDSVKIGIGIIIGVVGIVLCGICALVTLGVVGVSYLGPLIPTGQPSYLAQDTVSPQSIGTEFIYEEFSIKPIEYEFSGAYTNEYDLHLEPPEGAKFLWIYFIIENVGQSGAISPSNFSFSLIYLGNQIDADVILSSRSGYKEYDSGELFPGITREGWIRFTLPIAAEADQITIIFKPIQLFGDDYGSWKLSN